MPKLIRLSYWLGGLALVALGSAVAQASGYQSDSGPFVLFLTWGFCGLLGEVIALAWSMRTPQASHGARDGRPADGVVGVAQVLGVTGVPNPHVPRFRQFETLEANSVFGSSCAVETRECPPLLGRIVWTSLFIGRDGRPWLDPEIAETHFAMTKAGRWIERQAMHWGAAVNVELADTYFVAQDDSQESVEVALLTHGDRYAPADAREAEKLLVSTSRAAAALGFRDTSDWLASIQMRIAADVHVWLVHVRRGGCSQVVEHDGDAGTMQLAVCYAAETLYPEPLRKATFVDPVTIVHEVLHVFGATDKYEVPLRSFAPGTVTSRDVMRLKETKLQRLQVDPKTAAEIGWAEKEVGRRNVLRLRRPYS